MIKRSTLELVGGVPDLFVSSLYRGADLSHRARRLGLQNICNARALVRRIHRAGEANTQSFDRLLFEDIWAETIGAGDPFHNPNFSQIGSGFIEETELRRAAAHGVG
jgi:hypothetical protein